MTQFCALTDADITRVIQDKLKTFGGVKPLKDSLGTNLELPNFDTFNNFIESIIKDIQPGTTREKAVEKLKTYANLIIGNTGVVVNNYLKEKVDSFWSSAPKIIDNSTDAVNSSNPNVTDELDNPENIKALGIDRYFTNVNHIQEFIDNFRNNVNEQLFMYTNTRGKVTEVNDNQLLNEAIKLLKNRISQDLIVYLQTKGITEDLDPEIYNTETFLFNETLFNNLIKTAARTIRSDNYFLNESDDTRLAFNNLEMLRNFDKYVELYLPSSISIVKGYKNSNFEPNDGVKYKKANKMHVDKHYGSENDGDIFNHTNESMRIFIESIPYYDSFSGLNKRLSMNMFNTIFAQLNNSFPDAMADMRVNPEEQFMNILENAMNDSDRALGDRVYLTNQLEGVYNKMKDLYTLQKNTRFGNNLYSIIANYVNKLTTINYNQLVWDKNDRRYKLEKLSNRTSTKISSDLEKEFQTASKYRDFNLANVGAFDPQMGTYTITTSKGVYTIPFDGSDMTITTSNNLLTTSAQVFSFIMDQDGDFREIMNRVFANKLDSEVLNIAFKSYNLNFMKIFNLMGNIILNNEFSQGTKTISGISRIEENTNYFNNNEEGAKYKNFIRDLIVSDVDANITDLDKRIFNPVLGTLRVAGFNQGDTGRDVIYNAIADSNGDSVRSYAIGASGNMLSLTRLPNLINADKVLFRELYKKSERAESEGRIEDIDPFRNNNIFSDLFDLAADTLLKTTITNKDGTVANTNSLSVSDLIVSQITADYFGNPDVIYTQPVTYADKSQVWLKGIKRNKRFEYNGLSFDKGLAGATISDIQQLHYQTMSTMVNSMESKLVRDFNILYSYLLPGTIVSSYSEATDILSKSGKTSNDVYSAIRQALNAGYNLEIYPEIHYSSTRQGLQGNETLQRTIELYNDFSAFQDNQQDEKKLWAYVAAKEGVSIEYSFANGNINSIIKDFGANIDGYKTDWVNQSTGELILFKIKDNKGEYVNEVKVNGKTYDTSHYSALDAIKFDPGYTVELNPEIDKFFEINALVTNNYLAATVGMPFIHPAKTTLQAQIAKIESDGDVAPGQITEAALRKMEAIRTSAHSKRMVIYGATIHPFIQLKFDGIPDNYNISCVADKITTVFNLQGGSEKQKQYDGGVWENPFIAIWEKNALPELALSPIHRKSIAYFPNSGYLASGLGKWATFAFNNEMIRNASSRNIDPSKEITSISGHDFMRKMTNHKWIIPNLDITNGGQIEYSGYYYYDENLHLNIRISGILRVGARVEPDGTINNIYSISREVVNDDGTTNDEFTAMYANQLNQEDLIINSNYDLWQTLGGEYSKSLTNNGITTFLDWSESSIDKVAQVASEVAIRRTRQDDGFDPGYETYLSEIREQDENVYNNIVSELERKFPVNSDRVSFVTQSFYVQPMKHSDIHYVAPESAIKNGSANINPADGYTLSNFELNSWAVSSLHLGIQLNADHHVDNSEISEMSQVISAMEQLGTTHDIANSAYKAIGQSVQNNLKDLNILIEGNTSEDADLIYYILGKELCKSFTEGKGWDDISLANAYLGLVLKEFGSNYNFYKKQGNLKFKLPFDDPNIFDAFYNSFASNKNREAIKRRYSGLQAVLTPSQDFNTLYEVDGRIVKYEDLLNDETRRDPVTGARLYQNAKERLLSLDAMVDVHEIEAGDYVELDGVTYMVQGFNGGMKNGIVGLSYIRNMRGQQVKKLYSQGRNLKNANHKFTISSDNAVNILGGYTNFDIWDFDSAKLSHGLEDLFKWTKKDSAGQLYLDTQSQYFKPELGVNVDYISELWQIYEEVRQRSTGKWKRNNFTGEYSNDLKYINDIILNDLDMLDGKLNGKKEFVIPVKLRANQEVRTVEIDNIAYSPYEVMIGATQASSFGLRAGDSVQEILELKEKFFYNRFSENQKTLAKQYDAYLVHPYGNHLHVLLNNPNINKSLTVLKATELEIETEQEGETVYRVINGKRVYTINENTKWYQIPLGNNLTYELVVVEGANELKGVLSSGMYDRVVKNPSPTGMDILLNAASEKLNTKDGFILNLLKMSPNLTLNQRAELNKIKTAAEYLSYTTQAIDQEALLNNANKRYQSFLQYLDFIVARIPAQSMQSFMNMRIAGFINTPTNSALVPSTQFWLQGSDLDIDKAFMLGASISDSGYYNDWSDALFNYNSRETVDASNELPIPDGVLRSFTDLVDMGYGINSINQQVNILIDSYNNIIDVNNILGLSLDNYLDETSNDPNKIKTLARLIDRIQTSKVTGINLPLNLVDLVNSHSSVQLDKFRLNEALKNKVWFLLKQTGENIRNMYAQMNPISLQAAQDAAASSSEGKDSNIISLLNPATVMQLQLANSVGKDCIGISATGSKVAAAVIQHFNEIARRVNAGERGLSEADLMIPGKAYKVDGNANAIKSKPTLTNINWTNVPNLTAKTDPKSLYNTMLNLGISDDIFDRISVLISISTDNAKELILQKIGATKDLMSIYTYGILIGEDFSNIAEFMTKPEVSMVQRKSGKSLLNDSKKDMSLAKAVSYYLEKVDPVLFGMKEYLGGIDKVFKDNFESTVDTGKTGIRKLAEEIFKNHPAFNSDNQTLESVKFDDLLGGQVKDPYVLEQLKLLIDALITQAETRKDFKFNKIERADQRASRYGYEYMEDYDTQDLENELLMDEFNSDLEDGIQMSRAKNVGVRSYLRYLNEAKNRINDLLQFENRDNIYENITTLHNLKKDSESLTLLGRFLSINQGIPTKQVDRINKTLGIEASIRNKIPASEDIPEFNLMEFFKDPTKLKIWIQAYADLKEPFNVLSIVANSPHFSEMWKGFVTVQEASNAVAIKSWLTEKLTRLLRDKGIVTKLGQKDIGKIKGFISDLFVNKFLSIGLGNKTINAPTNMNMVYNDTGRLVPINYGDKPNLDLSNTYDRMSFKYWFENSYLPEMERQYPNNQFIKALGVTTYSDDMGNPETVTRLPINMMSNRDADKAALTNYTNGFVEIKNIKQKIGGEFIGNDNYQYTNEEIFFLYNLLVNKNKFGEASLTKVFDSSIWEYKNNVNKPDNLIIDYFNFERGLIDDPNIRFNESEDMNFDDLELRFATRGRKNNQYYFNYDGYGIRRYFNKANDPIEIEPSALQLPILLKVARTRGQETVKNLSERLKDLIYNNKVEIKFVECHG